MQLMAQHKSERNSDQQSTDPKIIDEWPLNSRERLRVTLEPYRGVWLVNLRKWYEAAGGEFRPTKQGVALSVKHLPQFVEAVTRALSIAGERGLIPADSEGAQ